jgi:hypothetical protein
MEAEIVGLEFLGEWHKHPGALSSPSFGDVRTITEIMSSANLEKYLAAIITGDQADIEINAYLFNEDSSYKHVPCSSTSKIERSKKSHTKESIDIMNKQERRVVKDHEEEAQSSKVHVSPKLHDNPDSDSKEEQKVFQTPTWYETVEGRKRLALERSLMATRFPDFVFLRKDSTVFWHGAYKSHNIILKYPTNYPRRPLNTVIEPHVEDIPQENRSYYATLAAQTAYLRIESSALSRPPQKHKYVNEPPGMKLQQEEPSYLKNRNCWKILP